MLRTSEGQRTEITARKRVFGVALLGVMPLTLFVQWSDMQVGGTMAAGPFPPLAACLQFALLFALNRLVMRLHRGKPFLNSGELLVVLAVWLTANMVAGRGLLHPLLASLAGPAYYARSGVVTSAIAQHLPDWLAVTNKSAAGHFFEGYHVAVPWNLWWRPLLTWSLFFLPFLTANICLCALFEQVWVRHEKLAYPLVALPLEAFYGQGEHRAGFRRAVAFGLAVPLLLHGFGVAHAYVPVIPCIPFYNDLSSMAVEPPWNALRPLYLNLYPLLIGLTFLAPADVTFSVWFFLLLNKAETLLTTLAGWNDGASSVAPMPPFLEEQSAGAYLALAALLVWNARRHLKQIAQAAFQKSPVSAAGVASDGSESADYRAFRPLFLGFLFGGIGVQIWCFWTGLPFWFSVGFFGFYLAVALVLSRLMAEGGVSWILAPILPDKLILSLTGSSALPPMAITRLMLQVQHLRDTRQMLTPAVFQAGKIRDAVGFPLRAFYGLLLAAVALALLVGTVAALTLFYRYGALNLLPNSDGLAMSAQVIPTTAVGQVSSRLLTPVKPSGSAGLAVLAGGGATWALSVLRMRFPGWPLHPLGYALTGTLQQGYANKMLFSIFLGWLFKSLTLRFGGIRGFRLLRGTALGLILGDLLMGGLLKLLDALLGPGGYAIF